MALPFGVPALDERLGPVAEGGSVLLEGPPEVEGLPWLLHAAASHMAAGRPVVFVAVVRAPARIQAALAAQGLAADPAALHFVDAHSALLGDMADGAIHVRHPDQVRSLLVALEEAAVAHPGAILLIEALDALVARIGPLRFQEAASWWRNVVGRYLLAAAHATTWDERIAGAYAFDARVLIRNVEDRLVLNQVFEVSHSPWHAPSPPCLYKVNRPGGIYAYIPKIVVVGPHDAGKTTFVHAACAGGTSVERMGTTVALDRGTMNHEGIRAELFGTPGQARFDALLPTLAAQASGAILVVDATDPGSFVRAGEMLKLIWKQGLTTVVALNKQDLPGALDPPAAADRLELPPFVSIEPCIAADAASARGLVGRLARRILEGQR